jgi:GMC oxidoreductase/Thiamine pyrophosphate enzyme, C-terminal TPP binding domain
MIFDESLTVSPELARYLPPTVPGHFFQTQGGSLGVGIPGAIGMKLAHPDKTVVGFTGDGGSMYTTQALWTAAHHKIGTTYGERSFDYIVIGAGTTGCVIANRLSEDPSVRVLLLEGGGMDDKPGFHNTDLLSYFGTWWTDADWQYMSEEEPYLNRRRVPLSQGKVVGGGSAINGMIHVRGSRHDCDYWQYLGNEGWGYSQVLPYFKKSDCFQGHESPVSSTFRIIPLTPLRLSRKSL